MEGRIRAWAALPASGPNVLRGGRSRPSHQGQGEGEVGRPRGRGAPAGLPPGPPGPPGPPRQEREAACAWTFAQASFSVSVRLNTGWPGRESGSGQK
jgi:hypothetical protein